MILSMLDTGKLNRLLTNTGDMCLKRRAKEVILGLNPQPRDRILDAGCGDGFYLHLLSQLTPASLTGLDDNPKALDLARGYVKSSRLKLVTGDVMKLPFKKSSFNKIICSEVLEHLADDVGCLREFRRVLAPGGTLAITVPSHNYPFLWDPINWLLERLFGIHFKDGFWAGVWNQHLRLYTPRSLQLAVKAAGLKIKTTKVLTRYGLPFNHLLLNIGYRLRKSALLPTAFSASLSKFSSPPQSGFYQLFLNFVNRLDKLNDRPLSINSPGVGIFLAATKP